MPRRGILPGSRLLDRIIRGRAWIPVLGVLLVGIVGMRVEVLKLGSRVGTEMQQASALQSADEALSSRVSALSETARIESRAEQMGMQMPLPTDVHLVQASSGRNLAQAISHITPPDPQSFLSGLHSERQADSSAVNNFANVSAVGVLGGGYVGSAAGDTTASTTAASTTTASTTTASTTAASTTTAPTTTASTTTASTTTASTTDTGSAAAGTTSTGSGAASSTDAGAQATGAQATGAQATGAPATGAQTAGTEGGSAAGASKTAGDGAVGFAG